MGYSWLELQLALILSLDLKEGIIDLSLGIPRHALALHPTLHSKRPHALPSQSHPRRRNAHHAPERPDVRSLPVERADVMFGRAVGQRTPQGAVLSRHCRFAESREAEVCDFPLSSGDEDVFWFEICVVAPHHRIRAVADAATAGCRTVGMSPFLGGFFLLLDTDIVNRFERFCDAEHLSDCEDHVLFIWSVEAVPEGVEVYVGPGEEEVGRRALFEGSDELDDVWV